MTRVVLVVAVESVAGMRGGSGALCHADVGAVRRGGGVRVLPAGLSVVVPMRVIASVYNDHVIPPGGICRGVGFR